MFAKQTCHGAKRSMLASSRLVVCIISRLRTSERLSLNLCRAGARLPPLANKRQEQTKFERTKIPHNFVGAITYLRSKCAMKRSEILNRP